MSEFPRLRTVIPVSDLRKHAMQQSIRERGPIVIVRPDGEFAKTPGALLTTAITALPGESEADCLARYGLQPQKDDLVFNFDFDPLC
jgi:hypothetical protein